MPKYLIAGSYTAEGAKALMREGGSARRAAVEKALTAVGGKLESFYFAFGETDVYAIAEMPDNVTAAAVSLATSALGLVGLKTAVLMTPQEMDAVAKKAADYRPPGK